MYKVPLEIAVTGTVKASVRRRAARSRFSHLVPIVKPGKGAKNPAVSEDFAGHGAAVRGDKMCNINDAVKKGKSDGIASSAREPAAGVRGRCHRLRSRLLPPARGRSKLTRPSLNWIIQFPSA